MRNVRILRNASLIAGLLLAVQLLFATMAYAGNGPAVDYPYYDKNWRGRSATNEYLEQGVEAVKWTTWTKVTNSDVPAYWLRNRTMGYRDGSFYGDQVVCNTTTFHSAGDAIENNLWVWSWHGWFHSTVSNHALYYKYIGYADSSFQTASTESMNYA